MFFHIVGAGAMMPFGRKTARLPSSMNLIALLAVAFLMPCTVYATVMLYSDSLPEKLTPGCSTALLTDVACDPLVRNLRPEFLYPPESLSRVCTESCSRALTEWKLLVQSQCGNQTILADFNLEASVLIIPGSLNYLLRFTCLQESGRYCGPVAALAAAFSDPGVSDFNYISDLPEGAVRPGDCDNCLAERLRLRAGSPYFDGPIVASESLYESMTISCGIVDRPVTTTTLDYFTAGPQPTANVCDGSNYTIKSSDDCNTISKSQGVGTAWLLADNNLDAYCANFPISGTLCITNKCTTVTVGINDTCSSLAAAANITETQFHAWNPVINTACSNLSRMNGTEVCVDAPGRKFIPPTGTDLPPLTPTTPAPKPTDAAQGSEKPCGRWYDVRPEDFCNSLTVKFGIPLADFLFLNTGVNENCTNLFVDESYCVQAVGDINTYSGRPGHVPITIDPSATFTGTPFINLPNATATSYSRGYTPLPTAAGTRDDCVHYFAGDDYQLDVNGSTWDNNCVLAAFLYGVDLESFAAWNPSLGDVTLPSCAFETGVRYCGSWYLQKPDPTESPTPTITTTSGTGTGTGGPTPPAPTHTGQPANCSKWDVVGDNDSCDSLAADAGISRSQFLSWNPAISEDCVQNFWLGYAYCVGVSGTATSASITRSSSTTRTRPPPGATPPPAQYLQAGQPANCVKWDRAVSGDYCGKLAERNRLTVSQLAALNPALGDDGADCDTQMWIDYYYCVTTS